MDTTNVVLNLVLSELWELVKDLHEMALKKYHLDLEYQEDSEIESLHSLAMMEEKILKCFYQSELTYENFHVAFGYAIMAIAHWNKAMHRDIADRIKTEFIEYLDKLLGVEEITITDYLDYKDTIQKLV